MKTNRIITTLAAAALAISVSAQQSAHDNYVGINFGGGLNTMLYDPSNGDQSVGGGLDVGIFYGHFFNKWVGLGVGFQYTWANAYAKYNWSEVTPNLTHPSNPGVPYDLTTSFNDYVERQDVGLLSIPVEVLFRKAFNDRVALIGGVGFSIDIPVHGSYYTKSGEYTTTGVFHGVGPYSLSDMPEHGFGTYSSTHSGKFDNRAKVGASVIGDIGARFALNDNWGIYCGLYVGYGFTNLVADAKDDEMSMVVPTDGGSKIDYRGTLNSNQVDKANLLRFGVKVAVDFGWPGDRKRAEKQARLDSIAAAEAEMQAKMERMREKARQDSIAAAEAEKARLAALRDAEQARLAEEQAKQARMSAEEAARLAKEKAIRDSIAAAEAERARLAAERAAYLADIKARGLTLTVHFDTGGDQLKFKNDEQEITDALSTMMKEDESIRIVITGHTDNTGNADTNLRVWGIKRAEALKAYMVSKGVPSKNITCESKGQNDPVASNNTAEGRAQNRRASIRFE